MPLSVGGNSFTSGAGGSSASMVLSASNDSPEYHSSINVQASVSGFTPTSYTFTYLIDSSGNYESQTTSEDNLDITVYGYGRQKITVCATDDNTTVGSNIIIDVQDVASVSDYISNIGTLTQDEETVVRNLYYISAEKGCNFTCLYPFRGESSTKAKRNLIGPSYEMTWNGGWTFNSSGVTANGTNSDGDTGLNNNFLGQNSVFIAFYNRTDGASGVDVFGATSPRTQVAARWSSTGQSNADINNSSTANGMTYPADCRGFWAAWRDNSGYVKVYHRGPSWEKAYYWNTASTGLASGNFKLSAGAVGAATNRNYSFLAIGQAPPSLDAVVELEKLVNAQMTTLGLNVY